MYKPGVCDEYMLGMMNQVAQAMDESMTQEVSLYFLICRTEVWALLLIIVNLVSFREKGAFWVSV